MTTTGRPSGWAKTTDEYVTAMRAAGRSPGTVRLHRSYLARFATEHRSPWTTRPRDLLAFLAREDWSAETRRSARGVLRSFYGWAHGSGYVADNPADALPTVRIPKRSARPAPEFVYRAAVRDALPRERVMLLLAAHGLRCMEVASVHATAWDGERLAVTGKGGRRRSVPVADVDLRAWLDALSGWAFPNRLTGKPLTPGYVSRLLSRAMADTWTGHTLRHRAGTRGYAGTRDLLAVATFLGHSNLDTTRIYVESSSEAVVAVAMAAVA